MPGSPLRLATRASPLALWQAGEVARLLDQAGVSSELVRVSTTGDRSPDVPLSALGAQGVFVKEVQAAVLAGGADAAVHSAKDLPPVSPPGLSLAAVPERGDPRDALVGARLSDLGPGAVVATGAPRRRAQLAWAKPGLWFVELRGNIGTRLDRVPQGGAAVVAASALARLGMPDRAAEVLSADVMVPQVGQGALAVECREEDERARRALEQIDHPASHLALLAERASLAELGPGCRLPVGAWAQIHEGSEPAIVLLGFLASADGTVRARRVVRGADPIALGRSLAVELLEACGGEGARR
jgi:hydroxymethylbilane synthase